MLTWDLDPMLLQGSTPLRVYGLLLALALALGFLWFRARWLRTGGREREAALFLGWALPGLILGARLGHCLLYDLDRTLADPLFLLALHRGGLASHGALAGLLLAACCFLRRHPGVEAAALADALAAPAALAVVLIRLGNFANSEIVGRITGTSHGVRFLRHDGPLAPPRHPVQLYEAALGLALLAPLLLLERSPTAPRGRSAALFLGLYFGGRILLERLKEPEGIVPASAPLTTGALLSLLPALVGGVWLLLLRRRRA
jgi:prolipoprotein diacylglyceryl transferase